MEFRGLNNMKYKFHNKDNHLSFHDVFNIQDLNKEHWLYITAHDDDPIIGSGMLLAVATHMRVKVDIVIVTDGNMGYQDESLAGRPIVELRKAETYKAYEVFGINKNNIHYLGYPDADLFSMQGRRKMRLIDYILGFAKYNIKGNWGLLNSMVYHLRKIKPTRVFLHTPNDYHPDHKVVFNEALWANFFSASDYWPELGKGIGRVPKVYEYFVYSNLTKEPDYQLSSEDAAQLRNASIRKYVSQGEIHGLVKELETAGPHEWFREYEYIKADRAQLHELFKKAI